MILTQWIKMKYLLKQNRVCFEQIRLLSNGVMSRNMDDLEVIRTRHCTTVMEKPNGPLICKKITSIQPVRWKKWVNPYPDLIEDELEEQFILGSGPGGQSINKTANCVMLKHKPTGLVVKCQITRSLPENRKKARIILQEKLDWHFNRENSIKSIEEKESSKKKQQKKKKTNEKLEKLRAFKEIQRQHNEKVDAEK